MTAQILACDDDATYLRTLIGALKPDFDTASCATTQTLLDRIEAEKPDAVLLDICFGDTREGLETLRAIRKSDRTLPVVIHSGLVGYGVMIEAMRLGATDYVPKGSSTAALVAQLN